MGCKFKPTLNQTFVNNFNKEKNETLKKKNNYFVKPEDHVTRDFLGLYHDFSNFTNTTSGAVTNGNASIVSLIKAILIALEKKCPINDDLLLLSMVYFKNCVLDKEGQALQQQFLDVLQKTVKTCINSKHLDKETKAKDYQYFKMFLLKSNVWMMPLPDGLGMDEKSDEKDNELETKQFKIVYDNVSEIVEEALLLQKETIWQNVEKEKRDDSAHWNELINLKGFKGLQGTSVSV